MTSQPTTALYIRLPDELHAAFKRSAAEDRRTLNAQVAIAIAFFLQHGRRPAPPPQPRP